jgi:hypothetical protein
VRKFLKGKGIWESSATKYARLVQLAKAEEIWRGVVSDAGVKKRSHALFARIRELVDNETPGQSAQAS